MDSILKPPMDLDGFGSNIKQFYPPVLNHTTTEGNFCNNNTFTGKFPLFIGQCQIQPSNLLSSYTTCGGPLNSSIPPDHWRFSYPFRKKNRDLREISMIPKKPAEVVVGFGLGASVRVAEERPPMGWEGRNLRPFRNMRCECQYYSHPPPKKMDWEVYYFTIFLSLDLVGIIYCSTTKWRVPPCDVTLLS